MPGRCLEPQCVPEDLCCPVVGAAAEQLSTLQMPAEGSLEEHSQLWEHTPVLGVPQECFQWNNGGYKVIPELVQFSVQDPLNNGCDKNEFLGDVFFISTTFVFIK